MSLYSTNLELKIPFYDLDPMNVVWHGNYVKYMEEARCKLFSDLNYNYEEMRNDNFAYPIAKIEMKYIKPAYFNQDIIINTTLEEIEPAIIIKYKILDKNTNEKLFSAKTLQIGVNIETRTSVYNAPERLKKILEMSNEK